MSETPTRKQRREKKLEEMTDAEVADYTRRDRDTLLQELQNIYPALLRMGGKMKSPKDAKTARDRDYWVVRLVVGYLLTYDCDGRTEEDEESPPNHTAPNN